MGKPYKEFWTPLSRKQRAGFVEYLVKEKEAISMGNWFRNHSDRARACLGGHAFIYLVNLHRDIAEPIAAGAGFQFTPPARLGEWDPSYWYTLLSETRKQTGVPESESVFEHVARALAQTEDEARAIHGVFLRFLARPELAIAYIPLIWRINAADADHFFYDELLDLAETAF